MAEYLNRATREIVVCLAGCVAYPDQLQERNFRGAEKAKPHLQAMMDEAGKAMEAIIEGIDQQQVKALLRYTNASELMALPKSDPRLQKEYYVVPDSAMEIFLNQATGDCQFCELTGKECNRCEIRKALLDSFVITDVEKGECPYKR